MTDFIDRKPGHRVSSFGSQPSVAKKIMFGLGGLQLGLLAAAWHFLYHLPASRIRGRKPVWFALTLVDVVGPLAFLIAGIRREDKQ